MRCIRYYRYVDPPLPRRAQVNVVGVYTVHVRSADRTIPLVGSPFQLSCVASGMDRTRCAITGTGLTFAVVSL